MEIIKKDINDSSKVIIRQLSDQYSKISENIEKSYYYGQKDAYEEMLTWFKNSQNRSIRFIPPKTVNNYLLSRGGKSKGVLNEKKNNYKDESKKNNKTNFNYLYYNQTFNIDNNIKNINEYNVWPTSVENAIYNNKNKLTNPFNQVFNNNIKNNEDKFHLSILANSNNNINHNKNNNSFISSINNNLKDSQDVQMKPEIIRNNFYSEVNLKTKKNNDK